MACVYVIVFETAGVRYIGSTKLAFDTRVQVHRYRFRMGLSSERLMQAYEVDPRPVYGLIEDGLSLAEARAMERLLIASMKPELNTYS